MNEDIYNMDIAERVLFLCFFSILSWIVEPIAEAIEAMANIYPNNVDDTFISFKYVFIYKL